jgi:hypothetical protein
LTFTCIHNFEINNNTCYISGDVELRARIGTLSQPFSTIDLVWREVSRANSCIWMGSPFLLPPHKFQPLFPSLTSGKSIEGNAWKQGTIIAALHCTVSHPSTLHHPLSRIMLPATLTTVYVLCELSFSQLGIYNFVNNHVVCKACLFILCLFNTSMQELLSEIPTRTIPELCGKSDIGPCARERECSSVHKAGRKTAILWAVPKFVYNMSVPPPAPKFPPEA